MRRKNNDLVAVANNRKLCQRFTPAVPRTFDQDCSYNIWFRNVTVARDCQSDIVISPTVASSFFFPSSSHSPTTNHYHPTVYQILSEIEDGRTPENTPVRFRFDENEFPGYSWRGYGVFSEIQVPNSDHI